MVNRREFLVRVGGMIVLPRLAWSQSAVAALSDRISLINAGTNVLALTTPDGLVLVDSGAPAFTDALIKELGSKPVRTLFNTHYHLENTGANETLGKAGARIVAQQSTKEWMSTPYWIPAEDRYEKPRPKAAQPTETFYASGSMKAGTDQIDYGYLIEAHTSGDIYVFFHEANVIAVGDVAAPARDPELDYFTGAWIGGRVDALDRLLKLSDDKTQIVPCFGPVMSRTELKAERDMMSTIYERTVDRVREGESAEDMMKAGVLNGLPRTFRDPAKLLYAVHKGLWAHHNKLAPNVV